MKKAFLPVCLLLALGASSCLPPSESRVRMQQLSDSIRVMDSIEALAMYESLHPSPKDTTKTAAPDSAVRDTLRPLKKPLRRVVRDSAAKAPVPAAPESPKDTNP